MSTPSSSESHWETLPIEISLSILKELPDLSTLHCLLSASPAATRVFETHGAEILEAHLTSGTIHKYTSAIIRLAVYVRSGISPPGLAGRDSFLDLYIHETTELRYKPPRWTQPPLKLASGEFPASVLRGVVASHYHHQCLMINCLTTYLERFHVLQPRHLVDKDFEWEGGFQGPDNTNYIGSWQLQPPTRPVAKHDIGPPTWCEEQRVLRGAWRVQLFEDFKASDAKGLLDSWQLGPPSRWSGSLLDLIRDLGRDGSCLLYIETNNLIQGWDIEPSILMQNIQVEEELIASVLDYTNATRAADSAVSDRPQLTSRTWPEPVPSQQDFLEVEWYTSEAILAFQDVAGSEWDHFVSGEYTPLQHVPWEFYRRRGFAIWCHDRMAGYGILERRGYKPEERSWSFSMLFMAWRSVLTEDELEEVARLNQAYNEEEVRRNSAIANGVITHGLFGYGLKFNDNLYDIQGWKHTGSIPA